MARTKTTVPVTVEAVVDPVETTPAKPPEPVKFSKAKILKLNRYANRRDYLSAVLEDGKNYTLDQVDSVIQNLEKKGKVK